MRLKELLPAVTLETWPDRHADDHTEVTRNICTTPALGADAVVLAHCELKGKELIKRWGGKLRQNQNELSCKYIYIYIHTYIYKMKIVSELLKLQFMTLSL